MKFFNLAITAAAMLLSVAPAMSVTITGGNAVISRGNVDGFTNFSILDGNNPISAAGTLTAWSIFAPANAGAVQLLIYRSTGPGYNLVGSSSLETPSAGGGVQNFSLNGGLTVQGGDLLGLYFQSAGSAMYDNVGGPMLYTNNGSGFANATNFVGNLNRTYSVSVTGSNGVVPEPANWALMIAGFGMVGLAARRRNAASAA